MDSLIEEYKSLREEIGRYQNDNFKIIEFGLTATAALFTIAFSDFVIAEARGLFLFVPWFILFPSTLLIAQRIKQTWRIGRYIESYLEPKLGFKWEKLNYAIKRRETKSRVPSFTLNSGSLLVLMQILLPTISANYVFFQGKSVHIPPATVLLWVVLTVLLLASVVYQLRLLAYVARPSNYVEKILEELDRMETRDSSTPEAEKKP
jgi:hypothetical protein